MNQAQYCPLWILTNLWETILALKERYKLTVVVVEHNLKVVMNTCKTISVLDHGQKIAGGPPEMIKNDHAVVEAYLGRELPDDEIRNAIQGQWNKLKTLRLKFQDCQLKI